MTWRHLVPAFTVALAMSAFLPASAQGIRAVAPLPGYACMAPNLTPEQMSDPKIRIHYYDAPSSSAHVVGWAAAVVLVRAPQQAEHGYLEALFPNGRTVWIKRADVRPWQSRYAPAAQCFPALMSNGKPGFDIH